MHNYPQDWKYGITNSSDLSNIDFTQVYPTDQSGLRYLFSGCKSVCHQMGARS
jgi:hypothetical protein